MLRGLLCRLFDHSLYPSVMHIGDPAYRVRIWCCRRCDHIEDRE